MKKIGDKELVFNETFFLPDKLTGFFEVTQLGFNAEIIFDPQGHGQIRWNVLAGNTIRIECLGWLNPLGNAINPPAIVGEYQGRKYGFAVASHRVGEVNLVTLQFYLAEARANA